MSNTGYRVNKKPTIREMTSTILELNNRVTSVMGLLSELEKAFSLYIEMNNDGDKFTEFIDEKFKEYKKEQDDAEADGNADKPNLQGDTDGESSGTKGIRKKTK